MASGILLVMKTATSSEILKSWQMCGSTRNLKSNGDK